jgi:hypothetical protein
MLEIRRESPRCLSITYACTVAGRVHQLWKSEYSLCWQLNPLGLFMGSRSGELQGEVGCCGMASGMNNGDVGLGKLGCGDPGRWRE